MKTLISVSFILGFFASCTFIPGHKTVTLNNPIIPGYFADPSVVEFEGKYYLYATVDPWGADFLSCWVSDDFANWTFHKLNWPTKEACSTNFSRENMVWAPSVIKRGDSFYMYISVGSEIWCGSAKHPLGPWTNMLDNKPLVPFDTTWYSHEIDAEVFVDDDARAYLYWGSGWGWINGRCWVAELNDDMASFKSDKIEITPESYFEAPWMIKNRGKYFLTYSEGKTIEDSYEVRYAVGDSPYGPFVQADNSPILTKNDSLQVYGPGHHTIVSLHGRHYILYHKHRLPFIPGNAYRQICSNPLNFDDNGLLIKNIIPENTIEIPRLTKNKRSIVSPKELITSSSKDQNSLPGNMLDQHYGTRWEASEDDEKPVLKALFDKSQLLDNVEIRFEYASKKYFFIAEVSTDGNQWKEIADYSVSGIEGSPVILKINQRIKAFRLRFSGTDLNTVPAVWEIVFLK
jgi:beta-xylosidase